MKYIKTIQANYDDCRLEEPTTAEGITSLEKELGREFPKELKEFLLQSNGAEFGGLVCIFGIGNKYDEFLNLKNEWKDPEYVTMYPNSQDLFFFASDGMGGYFGYTTESLIVHWDHEEDEVTEFGADDLESFITNCYQPLD